MRSSASLARISGDTTVASLKCATASSTSPSGLLLNDATADQQTRSMIGCNSRAGIVSSTRTYIRISISGLTIEGSTPVAPACHRRRAPYDRGRRYGSGRAAVVPSCGWQTHARTRRSIGFARVSQASRVARCTCDRRATTRRPARATTPLRDRGRCSRAGSRDALVIGRVFGIGGQAQTSANPVEEPV
jgi:hypothetical protein